MLRWGTFSPFYCKCETPQVNCNTEIKASREERQGQPGLQQKMLHSITLQMGLNHLYCQWELHASYGGVTNTWIKGGAVAPSTSSNLFIECSCRVKHFHLSYTCKFQFVSHLNGTCRNTMLDPNITRFIRELWSCQDKVVTLNQYKWCRRTSAVLKGHPTTLNTFF